MPTALKRYETYQQNLESSDPLKEELINYLQVSIQRQHEYIKNLILLRNGLVRADRLKVICTNGVKKCTKRRVVNICCDK